MHCKTKILGICTLGVHFGDALGTVPSLVTAVTPLPTWEVRH